jgi:hypothetical protein
MGFFLDDVCSSRVPESAYIACSWWALAMIEPMVTEHIGVYAVNIPGNIYTLMPRINCSDCLPV